MGMQEPRNRPREICFSALVRFNGQFGHRSLINQSLVMGTQKQDPWNVLYMLSIFKLTFMFYTHETDCQSNQDSKRFCVFFFFFFFFIMSQSLIVELRLLSRKRYYNSFLALITQLTLSIIFNRNVQRLNDYSLTIELYAKKITLNRTFEKL